MVPVDPNEYDSEPIFHDGDIEDNAEAISSTEQPPLEDEPETQTTESSTVLVDLGTDGDTVSPVVESDPTIDHGDIEDNPEATAIKDQPPHEDELEMHETTDSSTMSVDLGAGTDVDTYSPNVESDPFVDRGDIEDNRGAISNTDQLPHEDEPATQTTKVDLGDDVVRYPTYEAKDLKEQPPKQEVATNAPPNESSKERRKKTLILVLVCAVLLLAVGLVTAVRAGIARASVTPSPTPAPTTMSPTLAPSNEPTMTQLPSQTPTGLPSTVPSSAPTMEAFVVEPNPIPRSRKRSYFNYDDKTSFGPNRWRNVNMDGTYYREFGANGFGVWKGHLRFHVSNPTQNRCGTSGKQSPIFLQRTRGVPGRCTATHQIRTRAGAHPIIHEDVEKRIEGNKLRFILPRRPCLNVKSLDCRRRAPPSADFPNYSSDETHYSDMLNFDIKVPGEHVLFDTEPFDAEIQMLHIHLTASRMAQIGVPVRAVEGAFNDKFQAILNQFQIVYDQNMAACGRRGLEEAPFDFEEQRILQDNTDPARQRFDPYKDFLHDVFFYRYEGSATEPPCMSMTWFVMTNPVIIGTQQLRQVKKLLFTNVDESCQPTSVYNADQSVARPLQPLGRVDNADRPVMLCKTGDFLPDSPSFGS